MSAVRPLPPRPSLEYERKEAKALLRRLRAGDPDALARAGARHPGLDPIAPARARLADAQLVVAREYGFVSWPRLVRYFGDVERHQFARRQLHGGRDFLDATVRSLLAGHRARRAWVGRTLAAYVPRFYGVRADDVFAAAITEDDARLAVARTHGAPSWQVLLERAAGVHQPSAWEVDPIRDAAAAMAAGDLGALERVVGAHPWLLHPTNQDATRGRTLIAAAVAHEQRQGVAAMRPVMDWLAAHGFDRQRELNTQLCGHIHMSTEEVRDLLDRGADPTWLAPNGIPVLEHALLRYWNGEAVDVLAARATPRNALWVAAGLGDVDGVRRFLDRHGRPTSAARRLRPDFDAAGPSTMASPPDADDEERLVEAFLVAMLNGRTAVLEDMAARGAPVNSVVYGSPLIYFAVADGMTAAVECLVRCGADLDLRGWHSDHSAREVARALFEATPNDANRRRIVELCGMDPDVVLAERDARPAPPPARLAVFEEALALAGDDAARLGQPDVRPDNLLVGLLRVGGLPLEFLAATGRMDLARFRRELADRLRPAADRVEPRDLPMGADAQVVVEAAVALATERRGDVVHGLHLFFALTRSGHGPATEFLARYGASAAALNVELEKWL
jgi:hypothetical protein